MLRSKVLISIASIVLFFSSLFVEAYSFNELTILTSGYMGGGPGSVVRSLFNGLQKNNITYNHNPVNDDEIHEVVVVISGISMLQKAIDLKKNGKIKLLFAGPNLMVGPTEHDRIFTSSEIDVAMINSQWTRTAYVEQEPILERNIWIWPAGVDESFWEPDLDALVKQNKVLVYWKTEPESFCIDIENVLREYGFDPVRLRYGSYSANEYKAILQDVRFAVFISCSESQGIALVESWAMNVPTINWDPQALAAHGRIYSECSSCPYLSAATGLRWKDLSEFKEILLNLDRYTFSPREWVLENMTDELSVKLLLEKIEGMLSLR